MSSRPSRVTYSRLSQENTDDGSFAGESRHEALQRKKQERQERVEYYSTKLHAAIWVIAAIFGVYYTDFIQVCLHSTQLNDTWFSIGLICFAISTTLILYMAIWVPRVLKIHVEPSVYSPMLVPVAAVASVLSAIGLMVGLWPVYGLFTPGLLSLIWFGTLMSAHFLPSM